MTVKLNFNELANCVRRRYNVLLQFKRIDDKTFEVSCCPSRFISRMTLEIHIEAMRWDIICLTYSCNDAMANIVAGIIEHLSKVLLVGVEFDTEEKRVNIYPDRVNWLPWINDKLTLDGITVLEDSLEFELRFIKMQQQWAR